MRIEVWGTESFFSCSAKEVLIMKDVHLFLNCEQYHIHPTVHITMYVQCPTAVLHTKPATAMSSHNICSHQSVKKQIHCTSVTLTFQNITMLKYPVTDNSEICGAMTKFSRSKERNTKTTR
jgi:hypothetical protein